MKIHKNKELYIRVLDLLEKAIDTLDMVHMLTSIEVHAYEVGEVGNQLVLCIQVKATFRDDVERVCGFHTLLSETKNPVILRTWVTDTMFTLMKAYEGGERANEICN